MEARTLKKLKEELNRLFGEGNWKIRKVSKARRDTDRPSLTITEELEKIGAKATDYVIVAVEGERIIIYRV